MYKINNLLQQVTIIQKKYDEIAKITGENFNIFSVMNMEYKEVNTHSAIIGELLNPKGSHGQGDVFLKLFVEEIRNHFGSYILLNDFENLVNDKICERTISRDVDWENVSGGRIDLIIEDNQQILIIENKLYAIDQEYQLIRYKNYADNKTKKKAIFLYLTLDGKELENEKSYTSEGGLYIQGNNFSYKENDKFKKIIKENNKYNCLYYPISYETNIINWIEKCLEKTHSLPIIRETLVQYLHLIKKITNQSTNDKMSEEIKKIILSSDENIKGAIAVFDSNPKQIICEEFFNRIKKELGTDFNCENYNTISIGKQFSGMFISKKLNVLLWFEEDYNQLRLGIIDENKNWIETKTILLDDNFNSLKWEEVLDDKNINEIVIKIKQLIEEIESFKTE